MPMTASTIQTSSEIQQKLKIAMGNIFSSRKLLLNALLRENFARRGIQNFHRRTASIIRYLDI